MNCPSAWVGPANIVGSYAGVHNDKEKPIDAKDNGAFFLNTFLRYDDVNDGAAHTAFLGEKLADAWDEHWMSGTRATLRNMGTPINGLTYNTGLPRPGDSRSAVALPPMAGYEHLLEAVQPVEDAPDADPQADAPTGAAPPTATAAAAPGNPLWVGGFGSHHPNGAQFAFGDGSVRFLTENTNPPVLLQYAHRSDGKLPPRD
jgi:prepilin-type processing-associated H-X9-DG protein